MHLERQAVFTLYHKGNKRIRIFGTLDGKDRVSRPEESRDNVAHNFNTSAGRWEKHG